MIKRDEIKGPSCLTKAEDDEPLFVLRANDRLAPQIVRQWAAAYRISKGDTISALQLTKYYEALALAKAMEKWPRPVTA